MKKTLCSLLLSVSISNAVHSEDIQRIPRSDWSETELQELAWKIHQNCLTLDTHMDVPIVLKRPRFDISKEHSWNENASQVDFPRMKKGGIDGGFFVVYVGQGALTHAGRKHAIASGFRIADLIHETVEAHSDLASIATSPEEAYSIRESGKRVVFLGIENGYTIGRNIDLLKDYYDKGVRYFGITHSKNNDLADSSTDPEGNLNMGLSVLGRAAIDECNRLGIMVDISHSSDKTSWDILEYSKTPVLASHSGSYALYPHPRNLNDALLKEIAARDGVVQMNMFSSYMMDIEPNEERSKAMKAWFEQYRSRDDLSEAEQIKATEEYIVIQREHPKQLSTVSTVVDHIDHMVEIMGIEHLGLSGDFDGGGGVKKSMDIGQLMPVTVEMLRRGYTEEDLEKFWGANVMRVLQASIDYAASLAENEAEE